MYHGVDDIRFPLATFEQHLGLITQHFETFFASDIPLLLEQNCKTASGKPPIVLTFDDGLKNNATFVAPLIQRYNAKATFYLISGLLKGEQMIWNHELTCRLMLLSNEARTKISIDLAQPDANQPLCEQALIVHIKKYIDKVKRWPEKEKHDLLNTLRMQQGQPEYTANMKQSFVIMSQEDASNLPKCIEVGSHSVTHSILDTIPTEDGVFEVNHSKSELEKLLGRPVRTFCYPNGNYTAPVAEAVAQNYEVGVTTKEGFVYPGDSLNMLNRISMRINIHELSARLLRPS